MHTETGRRNTKKIRHKNIDRQMLHDDIVRVSGALGQTKTEYLASCRQNSSFDHGLVAGDRHPTEYLLRKISRDLRKTGIKRRWDDYIIPEPVQMELDMTEQSDPDGAEGGAAEASPVATPEPEPEQSPDLSHKIDALTAAVLELIKINSASDQKADIRDMNNVTPRRSMPAEHLNLKLSLELMRYTDTEARLLNLSRTEFINRVLLKYAKEHPHNGGVF